MSEKMNEYTAAAPASNGAQEQPPAVRTVAICGTATSSRDEILKQPDNVEIWSLNQGYKWQPRVDRLFDIHHHAAVRDEKHVEWLKTNTTVPVYMLDTYEHLPMSIRYPLEDVLEGGRYRKVFTSSISYMLALAIHERVSEVRLLGVDMATDSEWAYQRDGCLYWIGVAEGLGIKVYLPDISPLSQQYLYGREPIGDSRRAASDWKDKVKTQVEKMNDEFFEELQKKLTEHRRNLDACTGALQLAEQIIRSGHDEPIADPQEASRG
jgi:hypothetical protein